MRLPRKKLSRKLKRAIRSSNEDLYRIAIEAGMHPSTLSRFLNDARGVKEGDERVLRLAERFGIPPEEAFEE
ncbi:MAG: hypothetical protein DRI61_12555 [Chloroflexi bacterium]|nr:MAG: hypothetical protein DRI61_12555 [Chloroflexota bacterium]